MRNRIRLLLVLGVGFLAAQLPCFAAEDKDALKFVRIAADVASNVQSDPIGGYIALYVSAQNWKSASADGDLGPFVAAQAGSASRSMVCLFSQAKDNAICTYFDGDRAYGYTAVKAEPNRRMAAAAVLASYKPITREMLKKAPGKPEFKEIPITLDNGESVDGFLVKIGD